MVGYEMLANAQRDLTPEQVCTVIHELHRYVQCSTLDSDPLGPYYFFSTSVFKIQNISQLCFWQRNNLLDVRTCKRHGSVSSLVQC